jgi:hypothetical protein
MAFPFSRIFDRLYDIVSCAFWYDFRPILPTTDGVSELRTADEGPSGRGVSAGSVFLPEAWSLLGATDGMPDADAATDRDDAALSLEE